MEIEKGYTLSQFTNLIAKKDVVDMDSAENLGLIYKYNSFLQQPLKKEMFINELPPFNASRHGLTTGEYYKEYHEAEKKVIFKDVEIKYSSINVEVMYVNKRMIAQINKGKYIFNDATLYDLFNMTNGELELKNVEI